MTLSFCCCTGYGLDTSGTISGGAGGSYSYNNAADTQDASSSSSARCVLAPPGYWAPGGAVSDPNTRIHKCPSNKPNTLKPGSCSPEDCKYLSRGLVIKGQANASYPKLAIMLLLCNVC